MNRKMLKHFIVAAMICSCFITGCSTSSEDGYAPGNQSTFQQPAPGGFISLEEFSRARMVHVSAYTNKVIELNGTCYIDDSSMNPIVAIEVRRAVKAQNLKVVQDKTGADYVLTATISQQYARRRTYTTLKVVFSENKNEKMMLWTATGTVSGRGNYPVERYAASISGAVMYNFNRFATTSVGKRTLQTYYRQLISAGE